MLFAHRLALDFYVLLLYLLYINLVTVYLCERNRTPSPFSNATPQDCSRDHHDTCVTKLTLSEEPL